jgi:RNA polymerase sigma factor (sigma-70 family)
MSSFFARTGRSSGALQNNTIVSNPGTQDHKHARFSKLVLPHLDDAYALAYRIMGSHADAEDALQEACLRAFCAVADVEDNGARPWVMTIMRNTAYTWMRKNRSPAVFTVEDLEAVEVAQADHGDLDFEKTVIAKSEAETIIAALPDPFREAIILRDLHGLSYREISERTKVPIGTVMSRLARARSRCLTVSAKEEGEALPA